MPDLPTVVCYGDSNTWGFDVATLNTGFDRLPLDVRWPGVMAGELEGQANIVVEGLGGRTAIWEDPFSPGRNGLPYLLPCLRSHSPVTVVVIMLGTNDLKAYFHLGAPEIAGGVGRLVEVTAGSGSGPGGGAPKVLLVAPAPLGEATEASELWGLGAARETSTRLAGLYELLARHTGSAFLDAAAFARTDAADGVHLDVDSHDRLGRAVAAAVAQLL
jgi:lysophospholipase L1-like esterase